MKQCQLKLIVQTFIVVTLSFGVGASASDGPGLERSSIAQIVGDASLLSVGGHSLEVLTTSNQHEKRCPACPRIYLQAALHGDETLTSTFALWLFERIDSGKSLINKIPVHLDFDFVPKANPDSFDRQRYNTHGINLNRNFSTHWGISREPAGSFPFSEPETRAIKKIIEKRGYLMAIDIHGYVPWIVTPSLLNARDLAHTKKIPLYHRWLDSIRSHRDLLEDYTILDGVALGDGGAFEDWAFWEAGSLAFCLEIEPMDRKQDQRQKFFEKYEIFLTQMIVDALALDKEQKSGQIADVPQPDSDSLLAVKKLAN